MIKKIKKIFHYLTSPRSKNEDQKRREFILNVILVGSILLSGCSLLLILFRSIATHDIKISDYGSSLTTEIVIFVIFSGLYLLSKIKLSKLSSFILIFLYFLPVTMALYSWGTDLPIGLLIYALIIVISGILVSSRFALFMTFLCSFTIFLFHFLNSYGLISVQTDWRKTKFELPDAIIISAVFCIISLISWLFNRELENALKKIKQSELELKKERDLLEEKVEQRTLEIKKIQLNRMEEMAHFAEIGRLASGVFHDLLNPLTAVSLNLSQAKRNDSNNDVVKTKKYVDQAIQSSRQVEKIMQSFRKQISKNEVKRNVSIKKAINDALQILSYKIRLAKVKIEVALDEEIEIMGNPCNFHQVFTNIISNSIDAYSNEDVDKKIVKIHGYKKQNSFHLEIKDNGHGISKENIKRIFDPFYTTKNEKSGMGLGLAIVKNIIDKDLKGNIKVESDHNGTAFAITIPVQQY